MRRCVEDITRLGAHDFGDKAAIVFKDRTLTYRELDDACGQFARSLLAAGLQNGDRVTLYGANCLEWAIAFHGVVRAGGVINPVNMMLTPEEVEFVVTDCSARFLLAEDFKFEHVQHLGASGKVQEVLRLSQILADDAFNVNVSKELNFPETAMPDDLCMIGYTSGTTGHPKGAMLSNNAVLTNAQLTAAMHGRNESDIVVSALPLSHVYGKAVMNSILLTGGTLVMHSVFDAGAILNSITDQRATMVEGVPTMYFYLLDHLDSQPADLTSLRLCTVGGQTMPTAKMQQVEEAFGCPLIELWGMTEIAGLGATHPHTGPYKHGSIGTALPFCEARIVSTDGDERELRSGEIGEIHFRGPLVMQGYFNNSAATHEALTANGWLRTGDIAHKDEAGFVQIVDRKKDMILTAGYNVYPAELERVIAVHPSVSMVAVGGVPDPQKGEVAKAYIVLKAGLNASKDEIIAHCRKSLAAYKVPRAISFVADLPKTSSGKIMRRALRELDAKNDHTLED